MLSYYPVVYPLFIVVIELILLVGKSSYKTFLTCQDPGDNVIV